MGCSTMFQPSRKDSSMVQTKPLLLMGIATLVRILKVPQPSSLAASMISSGMARKLWVIMKVPSGTKIAGSTRA